jgi:hypothetical protein
MARVLSRRARWQDRPPQQDILDAEARGFAIVPIEAPEERSLPSLLAPALRTALLGLASSAQAILCLGFAAVSRLTEPIRRHSLA